MNEDSYLGTYEETEEEGYQNYYIGYEEREEEEDEWDI